MSERPLDPRQTSAYPGDARTAGTARSVDPIDPVGMSGRGGASGAVGSGGMSGTNDSAGFDRRGGTVPPRPEMRRPVGEGMTPAEQGRPRGEGRGQSPAGPGGDAQVQVREARIEDLAEIVDLLADGDRREGGDLAPYAAAFARITADAHQVQAVATLAGQIVGTLQLTIVPTLTARGRVLAHVQGVHTLSSLRGRGIGEALFAWAFEQAARRGAASVRIESLPDRVNEHRFYEYLGFAPGPLGFVKDLVRRR